MEGDQIQQLKPMLSQFLRCFRDCFARRETRVRSPVYVEGQLSDLPRRSVEPIALQAGVGPRTLQAFLSLRQWCGALGKTANCAVTVSPPPPCGSLGFP
jgi:SRSO17 transposase